MWLFRRKHSPYRRDTKPPIRDGIVPLKVLWLNPSEVMPVSADNEAGIVPNNLLLSSRSSLSAGNKHHIQVSENYKMSIIGDNGHLFASSTYTRLVNDDQDSGMVLQIALRARSSELVGTKHRQVSNLNPQ